MGTTTVNFDSKKLLFKVSRAAEMLDMSKSQLYKMIQQGSIRAVRIGQSVRIPAEVVREMAESGTER